MLSALILTPQSYAVAQQASHVFGNPSVWQWAPTRTYHVVNYKLALRFDEPNGEVFGNEVITLKPFGQHFREFYLNSSELTIDSVSVERGHDTPVRLAYTTEDPRLSIRLDRDYDTTNVLRVHIAYHGFPRTGLFFVNPDSSYPQRPREVYSQGESEFNRFWFPCWDYPNDMATSETITTVPEGQVVVSNGRLVSTTHSAGTVTYDWVEAVPHSSYLVSIAAGPWRKVTDRYESKPVDYYVPRYVDEATALRAFHLTPDMIGFFSRASGVDYPYEQYAQTTVRDYIFGGQENVSATTLTENTLHDQRAERDYPSTGLVSHELGQHWFGDYVQGRDWADIWLNEGFATYLAALYTQYHEGNDAFRFEIYNDQLAEQAQDRDDYLRPIVDRHYADPMDMFDAITHQKGAAVLDMLRYLMDGADATQRPASQNERLFQALHYYLVAHHHQTASTADLIEAIHANSGEEMGWFFRQWVFMAGHPDYRVTHNYNAAERIDKLTVTQIQQIDSETPIFTMPIEVAFHGANGEHLKVQVSDTLQTQEFAIPLTFEPEWVDFDPDDFIDKTVKLDQPLRALIAQAEKDPAMMSRLWAVQQLGSEKNSRADSSIAALQRVLSKDDFYGVRAAAATSLGSIGTPHAKVALLTALQQPDSRVATAVTKALGAFASDRAVSDALIGALHDTSSYAVQAAAATGLGRSGSPDAQAALEAEITSRPEVHVTIAVLNALASTRDPRAAAILLAQARRGVPEQIRVTALGGLARMRDVIERDSAQKREVIEAVRAALGDSYFPTQAAGEEVAGAFELTQFRTDIERKAQNAPMAMERDAARSVLQRLTKAK